MKCCEAGESVRLEKFCSGITFGIIFFYCERFFEKIGTDSVNHADSGDIKTFVSFRGDPILEFLLVGVSYA